MIKHGKKEIYMTAVIETTKIFFQSTLISEITGSFVNLQDNSVITCLEAKL